MHPWKAVFLLGLLGVLAWGTGCQPAGRYKPAVKATIPDSARPAPPKPTQPEPGEPPLAPSISWIDPPASASQSQVPIHFVHESNREEWDRLKGFWTVVDLPPPNQPVMLLGGSPLVVAGLIGGLPVGQAVKIKVPLGLDDPAKHIPAVNLPTLAKWSLGRRLFFDRELLPPSSRSGDKLACADCHQPQHGFTHPKRLITQPKPALPRNVLSLINGVYNRQQFWDGRVTYLEEVIQRTLADERGPADVTAEERHVWPGIIDRLRKDSDYSVEFHKAFGTAPTQDSVGKAIATYLRTILSGNSLHDQAELAMKDRAGKQLEAGDYEKALGRIDQAGLSRLFDDEALHGVVDLKSDKAREETARVLLDGWRLFQGKAGCIACHSGREFTDHLFHNIGEGDSAQTPAPGQEVGRFAVVPPGLKARQLIGAYRTPTLRALPRTPPYGHNGSHATLFDVVRLHIRPPLVAQYLDPRLSQPQLTEPEMRSLVLFLRSLDGEPLPDFLTNPAKQP